MTNWVIARSKSARFLALGVSSLGMDDEPMEMDEMLMEDDLRFRFLGRT
jgi:hypothetical protein